MAAWTSCAADLEQSLSFDIHPQPLSSALIEFSRQSKFQVLTASADLSGYHTRGVHGQMSVRAVRDLMLVGTGLSYRKVGTATISVGRLGARSGGVEQPDEGLQAAAPLDAEHHHYQRG